VTARAFCPSPVLAEPHVVTPRPFAEVYNQASKPTKRNVGAESAGRMRVMTDMNSRMPPEDSSDEDDDQDAKA